jgi:hypothetical protein
MPQLILQLQVVGLFFSGRFKHIECGVRITGLGYFVGSFDEALAVLAISCREKYEKKKKTANP